jgi:hypothetical protein
MGTILAEIGGGERGYLVLARSPDLARILIFPSIMMGRGEAS